MSILNISSSHSSVYGLDEILQNIPQTTTEKLPEVEETYQSYKDELNGELNTTAIGYG